ncbi:unnamed protein product [Cercopithifilaria johnstoni]|uniref:Cytochrome c oxidase subunit VIb n=1 Tax=Cercopithifilaria johnstoni TaxID=2874296 RepID=A0A8J2Q458_9BILA|nr:unnamed protein product [Cercopithifilaria johnstoni]
MSENTETVASEKSVEETNNKPERESSKFGELPLTLSERLEKLNKSDYLSRSADDPRWFDREYNQKQIDSPSDRPFWSAPIDARYQQIKMGRHCSDYYQDYYRCTNLLGEDYKPCKFFYNTFKDICPSSWIQKFDEWREEGVYPGHFDR